MASYFFRPAASAGVLNATAQHMPESVEAVDTQVAAGLLGKLNDYATPWTIFFTLLSLAVVYDQVSYLKNKAGINGPSWKIPFVGPFLESVYPDFNVYLQKWNLGDLYCVSIFHKFVVLAVSRDMARKVFNSPQYVKPCVVPIAYKLLRPTNWVFLDGQAHTIYRKGLNGLFTRQSLDIYLARQQVVYQQYFDKFLKISKDNSGKHVPFMLEFRELMCANSCRTFCGHYMDQPTVEKIADRFFYVMAALELVNFPIILPYTKTWRGLKASDYILGEFTKCAAKAKVRVKAGGEVTCILDAWVKAMFESERYTERKAQGLATDEEKPATVIKVFTDWEIAQTLFTFLLASQDANSSACTWMFQFMADNPEMLNRVRAETVEARNGDFELPLSTDLMDKMPYTRAVVKEVLRYRPPVLMVPYLAKKDYPITPDYTVPKDSVVVPTIWPALHDPAVYPDPDSFVPDRWITGNAEEQQKNWLVFGTGPHYCLGQTYVLMNLMSILSLASVQLDWTHEITKDSEKIKFICSIFPEDDCLLRFQRRGPAPKIAAA